MTVIWYAVFGLVVAVPISLAIGRTRRRQYVLALACPAVLGVLMVVALARGCPANAHECSPEFTLFIGALLGGCVTVGWLLGIGVAVAIRRMRHSRSGSSESQGVR